MELAESRRRSGPLCGIRIIEIGAVGPVPYACMLLSDMGAEIVRVDRMQGDVFSGAADPRYDFMLRGRRRIAVDLKTSQGVDIVLRLVGTANCLVEGFRPGVAEKLGLGPDVCLARNSSLVYGRMTGWGQTGSLATAAGHDINYIALTGVLHAIGEKDGAPVVPLNLIGDFGGGALFLVVGLLAGLIEVRHGGRGQVVDAAMVDGVTSMMTPFHAALASGFWSDERGSNLLDGGAPFYGVYEAADGKYVAVGAIEPKFYAELVGRLGLDPQALPPQFDKAQWPALRAQFAAAFRKKTRDEWCCLLEGTDVCFAPVLGLGEVQAHPHVRGRGLFEYVAGLSQPAPAPRFSQTPGAIAREGVAPGFDTDEILGELGYAPEDIVGLRSANVVGGDA